MIFAKGRLILVIWIICLPYFYMKWTNSFENNFLPGTTSFAKGRLLPFINFICNKNSCSWAYFLQRACLFGLSGSFAKCNIFFLSDNHTFSKRVSKGFVEETLPIAQQTQCIECFDSINTIISKHKLQLSLLFCLAKGEKYK